MGSKLELLDHGVSEGNISKLDVTGPAASCTKAGDTGTCTFSVAQPPAANYYLAGSNADGVLYNATRIRSPFLGVILNGNFETNTSSWSDLSADYNTFAISTDYAYTGSNSLKLQDTDAGSSHITQAIKVRPNTAYLITGYVLDLDATRTSFFRGNTAADLSGTALCSSDSPAAGNTGQWDYQACYVPATNTASTIYLALTCAAGAPGNTCYYDNIRMVELASIAPDPAVRTDYVYLEGKDDFRTPWVWSWAGVASLQFDGFNDYVTVADHADLEPTTGLTVAATVTPYSEYSAVAVSKVSSGSTYQYSIQTVEDTFDDGKVKIRVTNSSTVTITSTGTVPLFQPARVVFTIAGDDDATADDTCVLYINGVVDTTVTCDYDMPASTAALEFGRGASPVTGKYFHGWLDDIRLYSAALSSSAVAAEYATPASCVGNETNIVGCWTLDQTSGTTATDTAGTAQSGTLTNMGTTLLSGWRTCKLSNCLALVGWVPEGSGMAQDQYLRVKHHPSVAPTTDFSLSFWLWRDVDTGAVEYVLSKSNAHAATTNDADYWVSITASDKLQFGLTKSDDTTAYLDSVTSIAVGQWYHVVLRKDNTTLYIHLDGTQDASGLTSGTIGDIRQTTTSDLFLGRYGSGGSWSNMFRGKLDDLQVYGATAISTGAITTLYNGGAGTACAGTETGLTACWPFNETVGQIAAQVVAQTGLGNDSNDGLTSSTPLRSLTALYDLIPARFVGNCTIHVASGDLVQTAVTLVRGYTAGGPFTCAMVGYSNPVPNQFTNAAIITGTSTGSNTGNFPGDSLSLFNDTGTDKFALVDSSGGDMLEIYDTVTAGPTNSYFVRIQGKASNTQLYAGTDWPYGVPGAVTYRIYSDHYLPTFHGGGILSRVLHVQDSNDLTFTNVRFQGARNEGLNIESSTVPTMERVSGVYNGYAGVSIDSASPAGTLNNLYAAHNGYEGLRIFRASNATYLTQGFFADNFGCGVCTVWASSLWRFERNRATRNRYAGYDFEQNTQTYGVTKNRADNNRTGIIVANNSTVVQIGANAWNTNIIDGAYVGDDSTLMADLYSFGLPLLNSAIETKTNGTSGLHLDGGRCTTIDSLRTEGCTNWTSTGNGTNFKVQKAFTLPNAAPTMGTCGTSPSVSGTNTSGKVTVGSGTVTACTVNFSVTFAAAPACTITHNTLNGTIRATTTTTTLDIAATSSFSSNVIMYSCRVNQ